MNIDDAIHGISSMILSAGQGVAIQGTGFFYQQLGPIDPSKGAQWREVKSVWLVTNRHVMLPKISEKEIIPDTVTFFLRKLDGESVTWSPIQLEKDEIERRLRVHSDKEVDVAALQINDLLTAKLASGEKLLDWYAVHKEQLAGNNNINVEVGDDVLVVGYPRGFFDRANIFPVVKSGVVSSRWGANFEGKPYFLIDAKLFPGSSGSIVISKPQNIAIAGGQIVYAKEKQFAFLGIYSGEPVYESKLFELEDITIIRKAGFNLGVVWYGTLVEGIITGGKPPSIA